MRLTRLIWIIALLIIMAACSNKRNDTSTLFSRYLEASNAHDLETLEEMTDDDIVWKIGPYTLTGKEEALPPHAYDAIMNTSLDPSDIVVRGDTVECVLIERNDVTRAFGVDGLVHYARYVFRNGLMYRKEPWKEPMSNSRFTENLKKFRAWMGEEHPGELIELDSLGTISHFGLEVGELRSRLLREWVEAGRP